MKIGSYEINVSSMPYIIAEAGVNHNGSFDLAVQLVDEAVKAGAHAIKWQIYKAETLCLREAPRFWNWDGELDRNGTQFDSYEALDKFSYENHRRIAAHCRESGIEYLATPFDEKAVIFLESIDVNAYKVASCDCNNFPFLKLIASTQKTVILSTGASSLGDIEKAVNVIESCGNRNIIILHCILCYPTMPEDANLKMISTLKKCFPDYIIGFSDHTLGTSIPKAAVALGAEVIEKHYTVDKTLPLSADHWLSVDPNGLEDIVQGTAQIKKALGSDWARPIESEKPAYLSARRSIVADMDIPRDTIITKEMMACKRPGTGLVPEFLELLIGARSKHDIKADHLVSLSDFDF